MAFKFAAALNLTCNRHPNCGIDRFAALAGFPNLFVLSVRPFHRLPPVTQR